MEISGDNSNGWQLTKIFVSFRTISVNSCELLERLLITLGADCLLYSFILQKKRASDVPNFQFSAVLGQLKKLLPKRLITLGGQ